MFVINKTKKEMLKQLVEGGKNCLLTGATGSGKTTLCVELAKELKMNSVIINCGSTQDARTSLLGFFTLENGNTTFQESDFLKAIQTPNTLIVLDELSRASDDAFNIIFPLLDFRKSVLVEELESTGNREIKVDPSVRFIATANIGLEYSSARMIDRALLDRFLPFNLGYLSNKELTKYITKTHDEETATKAQPLVELYEYSHKLVDDNKITTRLSPRMVLEVLPLLGEFKVKDILNHVILSMYEQDSSSIVNDANILREFADSKGVFDK